MDELRVATWDETTDVVVVGSGGAALSAALTAAVDGARVVVVEKADVLGGTTGVSGGVLWVPCNHHLAADGLDDSVDDALAYVTTIADGRAYDDDLMRVFVETAPRVLEFLEEHSPLRTHRVVNLIDYYAAIIDRIPGCKPFSRSVEPLPYPARAELGDEWADRIAARSTLLSLGASTTLNEDLAGGLTVHADELARREREGVRAKGAALVACLLRGVLDHGGDVRVSSPVDDLVTDGSGAVVGVRLGTSFIRAERAVILACGGFEWNPSMVRAFLGYDVKPLSPGGNTGDGHRMAMAVGAQLGMMDSYWGQGAAFDPAITDADGRPAAQMMTGLGPGSIVVNGRGRRFMSGGYTYNDFPKPFGNFDQDVPGLGNRPPGWVIFGSTVKERQPILTMRPGEAAPPWLPQASSIAELADRIGIDAAELEKTVAAYNDGATRGVDEQFATANPQPVEGPVFYAIEQWPASLGTNGGCQVNAHGQVVRYDGEPIPGLYAAGNTSATVLGGAYVGGGTPIALGATFGHLAARHAASR
jgi:succinate dehydrogenase/fumarate reductase flavoprotein subunit